MHKIVIIILLLSSVLVVLFLNLGRFIDVTQPPQKVDLIVSLGGDSGCRMHKAVSLYEKGFSTSKKFLYTGDDSISKRLEFSQSKQQYLIHHGLHRKNRIYVDTTLITNTMEEVYFVKQYMLARHYHSVMFVSHPHHSRRIATLAGLIADYAASGLEFEVVSCEPNWWDRQHYYTNKTAIKATLREMAKLLYNVVKYATPLRYYTAYMKENKKKKWDRFIAQLP